jgi:ABC-type amino acid transport substrate-binding protein
VADEKRLTFLGKLVILIFVAGCFYGAWFLFQRMGYRVNVVPPLAGTAVTSKPAAQPPAPRKVATAMRTGVWQAIRQRNHLLVGFESDAPPMYFANANNRPDGFEFQLARQLGAEMGIPDVRFVDDDYGKLPDLLREGSIDLIVAGYVPDPSIQGVEWSESYLDFGLCLIVNTGSAVTEPEHLRGRTVAVYDDPAAVRWVKENIPGATIRTYSGDSGWFEAIEKREADALVYDYPFAAAEIRKHPRTKIVKFNLNASRYAVGIPAGNDDLLDAVNQALRRIKGSPLYADLIRGYVSYQSDDLTKPIEGRKTHVVRTGESLGAIAAARLGSTARWEDIWKLNRQRIPNPHLIFPGYVLLLPEG